MSIAKNLLAKDPASQMLGISLVDSSEGRCELNMTIRDDMINGYDVCHGGFIFTLADTALAFASCEKGQVIVSATGTIDYLKPAKQGDHLLAKAKVIRTSGRNIFCDVDLYNQKGECVAFVRGKQVKLK